MGLRTPIRSHMARASPWSKAPRASLRRKAVRLSFLRDGAFHWRVCDKIGHVPARGSAPADLGAASALRGPPVIGQVHVLGRPRVFAASAVVQPTQPPSRYSDEFPLSRRGYAPQARTNPADGLWAPPPQTLGAATESQGYGGVVTPPLQFPQDALLSRPVIQERCPSHLENSRALAHLTCDPRPVCETDADLQKGVAPFPPAQHV
jgi:hypothetical protein